MDAALGRVKPAIRPAAAAASVARSVETLAVVVAPFAEAAYAAASSVVAAPTAAACSLAVVAPRWLWAAIELELAPLGTFDDLVRAFA